MRHAMQPCQTKLTYLHLMALYAAYILHASAHRASSTVRVPSTQYGRSIPGRREREPHLDLDRRSFSAVGAAT